MFKLSSTNEQQKFYLQNAEELGIGLRLATIESECPFSFERTYDEIYSDHGSGRLKDVPKNDPYETQFNDL